MSHLRLGSFLARWGARGLLLGLAGCVEPYAPDVISAPTSYLVVDGFINGNGSTRIKLSRTANLSTTTLPPVEKGAQLFVVDDSGLRYPLTEKSSGSYQSDSLQLNAARKYQLRIITAGNTTYESNLVPLKVTPPIDKLDWKLDGDQVRVSLSTQDPTQQSRYYRWGVIETWEFTSAFKSYLEYDTRQKFIIARITPIYTCWRTERSSTIKQGSSAQLSQDALTDVSILSLNNRAERLKVRYSALVSQYAETAEEFAYLELLRKNTEATGTVNDPLPTQLTGNVHRTDVASEPVLGFVGAHTVQYKRLFINRQELNLPTSWQFDTPYTDCTQSQELVPDPGDKFPVSIPYTKVFNNIDAVPIEYLLINGDQKGYIGSSRACVDCRTRGSNVQPSFW
ncbi:MAG: DUF4249 domain-containing protein [Hymenobacter sp.]|nr:MAG: DUF4249 domain-containing protein [Hymenobacter sp.]